MARSVWKGPFVEESLIKKVDKQKNETNKKFNGPANIEESTATTIIPPNYNIVKDDFGNIIIAKEE